MVMSFSLCSAFALLVRVLCCLVSEGRAGAWPMDIMGSLHDACSLSAERENEPGRGCVVAAPLRGCARLAHAPLSWRAMGTDRQRKVVYVCFVLPPDSLQMPSIGALLAVTDCW